MSDALSPAGLRQLHDLMAAHLTSGRMPGLIALVARGDDVHVDAIGHGAFDDDRPLARNAIFRIASLSKPIVAAAAMTLIEDGTLRLDQSVDDLLPELADRRVLRSIGSELDDTVPAVRSITVEDLLSYRMGVGTILAMPGTFPYQRAEAELRLQSIGGPPWPPGPRDPDSWIAALGTLPLVHQPGEQWMYNTSGQVLGILLARAAATDLDSLLTERILGPLAMVDTGFSVPADRRDRLTSFYQPDPETDGDEPDLLDDRADSWWAGPPRHPDASGWLVSTVDDLWAFASMLRAGGTVDGIQVLSSGSVALMTTDRLTDAQRASASEVFLGEGCGWGLGMEVPATGSSGLPLPWGYGWDGGSGTSWRTNPETGTTGILLTQRAMISPQAPKVFDDFWAGVAAASD